MALLVINGVARTFQIICAAVVLGLSITLIKSQSYGTVAANNYAAFTGGFALLVGLIGVAAIFIESLAGLIMVAADALAALFLLAGGIAVAVKLRHLSCSSKSDENRYRLGKNELTNGGCIKDNKGRLQDCGAHSVGSALDRCVKNSADAAFMIITAVLCMGTLVIALLAMKRGGGIGRKGVVV
ncbi:non-classical export protein [Diplodia corticola]|uniref:Non-classical export protein n=1 Tax=Diplodia corticola TaxID=236234 RepID=A0A1J9R3C0_9PEZI|nr:non-classical export protein [Diplodia corticola]OJD35081.1 non-classical export protein [Diplodia corticola]